MRLKKSRWSLFSRKTPASKPAADVPAENLADELSSALNNELASQRIALSTASPVQSATQLAGKINIAVLQFAGAIPASTASVSATPREAASARIHAAARQTALAAGSLALPVGPLGWLTIFPEMMAIWKIQSYMVADIAAIYGKTATLTQQHMLYCLFRHSASQAVRDLAVRVGDRLLVRQVSLQVMQTIAHQIGLQVSQKMLAKSLSRWLPLVGAIGVGAYAYYDTSEVGATAISLFEADSDK